MILTLRSVIYSFIFIIIFIPSLSFASTLEEIVERDELICGIRGGSFGFGKVNKDGKWSGLDVDYCRALSAAVLKDPDKVEYIQLTAKFRFQALQDYEIDTLIRNTTWTLSRDTEMGLEFAGINFYDGQGFLAWEQPGKTSIRDYPPGAKICMIRNTTSLTNLYDFLQKNDLKLVILEFASTEAAEHSFLSHKCDLYSSDRSTLASFKTEGTKTTKSIILLNDIISKEPLGPVVRNDDTQWQEIVQWTSFALIEAEERGITQKNIDQVLATTKDPATRYFLGADPGVGKGVGLDDKWIYRIIKHVGNYGEVFDRNMGIDSAMKLDRGLNKLWTKGGLMYSPPFR